MLDKRAMEFDLEEEVRGKNGENYKKGYSVIKHVK